MFFDFLDIRLIEKLVYNFIKNVLLSKLKISMHTTTNVLKFVNKIPFSLFFCPFNIFFSYDIPVLDFLLMYAKVKIFDMKNSIITILILVLGFNTLTAQLKVGNNPTSINSKSNLEIEAFNGIKSIFVKDSGNVGIGTLSPNINAQLEINSNNKGLLLPRVALIATNNPAPLSAHVAGMVVYNTATSSTAGTAVSPGFYTNDGIKWNKMITSAGFIPFVVASASSNTAYTLNDASGSSKCRLSIINLNDGNYNNSNYEYIVNSSGTYNLAITIGYLLNNNSGFNSFTVFAVHANSSGAILKMMRLQGAGNIVYSGSQSSANYLSGSAVFRTNIGDKLYFSTIPCNGCVG